MDPKVSVLCCTYNQIDYLAQTIESFLAQKTDFEYEIIIHDDCSTDGTTELLRSYEQRYPDKIVALYEEENLYYNKGLNRYFSRILAPIARGKYIAQCEGDDYWIDENKLQMQYDYMEANPDCVLCVTSARVEDGLTGEVIGRLGPIGEDRDISFEEYVEKWPTQTAEGLWRTPLASMFELREICVAFAAEWDFDMAIGDNTSCMFAASKGRVHYIDKDTCVYRYQAKGAWTSFARRNMSQKKHNDAIVDYERRRIETGRNIDKATDYRYHDVIEADIACHAYYTLYTVGPFEFAKNYKEELGGYLTPSKWAKGILVWIYLGIRRALAHLGIEWENSPFYGLRFQRTRKPDDDVKAKG